MVRVNRVGQFRTARLRPRNIFRILAENRINAFLMDPVRAAIDDRPGLVDSGSQRIGGLGDCERKTLSIVRRYQAVDRIECVSNQLVQLTDKHVKRFPEFQRREIR